MAKKSGMAERVADGGHYESSTAPSLNKGQFQQVGTFVSEGDMTSVSPKGTSVNQKTGKLQNGE